MNTQSSGQLHRIPRVLTVAGSDSGGGAGIQADVKAITILGGFAATVVTALTAQNTAGVAAVHRPPVDFIRAQFAAVMDDIGADAAKTGMLADAEVVRTVCGCLRDYPVPLLVVDPVMVAKSGARLLSGDAIETLKDELLPLAFLMTPNLPEASVLLGREVQSHGDMRAAAAELLSFGCRSVLLKGGHLDGDAVDVFFDGREYAEFRSPRVDTLNTHGTGCSFSAAIATQLAKGLPVREAIDIAKRFIYESICSALNIGGGHGPLDLLSGARRAGLV